MSQQELTFDITNLHNLPDINNLHLYALFDRLQLMAEESKPYLHLEEHTWDEILASFNVTPDSKYYLVCYYLTSIYADYRLWIKALFNVGCQIDFSDNQFHIKDPKTDKLIINPEVYIDEKHNAQVYCKRSEMNYPRLRKLVREVALEESVLRLALSLEYWNVEQSIKELVDSLTYEWLNLKFDYMDEKPFKLDNPDEWVNLTQIMSTEERLLIYDGSDAIFKDILD